MVEDVWKTLRGSKVSMQALFFFHVSLVLFARTLFFIENFVASKLYGVNAPIFVLNS